MWVKMTKAEQTQSRRRAIWRIFAEATGIAWVITIALTFFYSGVAGGVHGSLLVAAGQLSQRLPLSIFAGILVGVGYFIVKAMPKNRVVCPICGIIKKKDDAKSCDCVVIYEDLTSMKWVEE